MSLQNDHRPNKLKKFIGNEAVVESLMSVLERKEGVPSTFLFTGPSGTGKTTLARIVKSELGCHDSDYIELDASDDRGIDAVRQLKEGLKFVPLYGSKKVILLDECHSLTVQAQEALLKLLEEPPSYVHICLATTNPEKLKTTFKRRCHQYELLPLNIGKMKKIIDNVLKKEKVNNFSQKVMDHIIDLADGSPGQALKLLDQVIDMKDEEKAISTLQSAGASSAEVIEICRALIAGHNGDVRRLLKDFTGDAESARYAILGYFNSVMLNKWDGKVADIMDCFTDSFINSGKAGLTLACYYALNGD